MVRVAVAAASLAWAGFVFTNTVGDPGRGERIAAAVLDDDDARAEVVAPISAAVMRVAPIDPTLEPEVATRVDGLLRSPDGARAFVGPFAGSWARMLGEDDVRPAEFDLAPLTDDIAAAIPQLQETDLPAAQFDVPAVPLPRTPLGWMGDVRAAIEIATLAFATIALVGFVVGFAIGDRRWVLRKLGLWATFAGASWVLVPFLAVWAAQQWASGADAVIEVAVAEAVSGLRTTAIVLTLGGLAAVGVSFVPAVGRVLGGAPQPTQPRARTARRTEPDRRRHRPSDPPRPAATRPAQAPRVEPTLAMPAVERRPVERQPVERRPADPADDEATFPIRSLAIESPDLDEPGDDDLWDFYAPRG